MTNIYPFVLVRGSSYRREKSAIKFEPNIGIIEKRKAVFMTFARKATQDLRQKLREKQRKRCCPVT
jgi:hypothetical protein